MDNSVKELRVSWTWVTPAWPHVYARSTQEMGVCLVTLTPVPDPLPDLLPGAASQPQRPVQDDWTQGSGPGVCSVFGSLGSDLVDFSEESPFP